MSNMTKLKKLGLAGALVIALALVGVPALVVAAPNAHANAMATQSSEPTDNDVPSSASESDSKSKPEPKAKTKLAEAKLRVCQKREKAITNVMGRIVTRGQKQLDLFSSIATRTEAFYADKGKTLSNYDTLVADVTAKKAAAQAAVDAIKANSVAFKCDGSDPKGASAVFKESLKTETTALKDYKTAVKNLIVGVKSAQGTADSTKDNTGGDQ